MPSHYLNQCWVIVNWTLRNKAQWNFNQSRKFFHSRKSIWNYCLWNDGHFVQGRWVKGWTNVQHFKSYNIYIKISLKFILSGPAENKSTLVLVMARHSTSDKSLPELTTRPQWVNVIMICQLIWSTLLINFINQGWSIINNILRITS